MDKIYKLFLDELDFIEKSSLFVSQEMKNADDCGGLVEIAISNSLEKSWANVLKLLMGIYIRYRKKPYPDKLISLVGHLILMNTSLKIFYEIMVEKS